MQAEGAFVSYCLIKKRCCIRAYIGTKQASKQHEHTTAVMSHCHFDTVIKERVRERESEIERERERTRARERERERGREVERESEPVSEQDRQKETKMTTEG